MKLYELTQQYKQLEELCEQYPCEEELKQALEKIDDDIEAKADGYAKIIANLEADFIAICDEIDRLTARKRSYDTSIRRLKENLMYSMKETGKTKFKTQLFSFSVAKNGGREPLVVDVTVDDLPSELVKVTRDVDKDALREYILETGDMTYGHFGDRGENLRIK